MQQTNEELQEKAAAAGRQKAEVEAKNAKSSRPRWALEEKAEQLALTSKYKSEFLANMSHELRTPLNSLLILSQQLAENADGNLTDQAGRVRRDHSLARAPTCSSLINDILDLSKIESGTMAVDITTVPLRRAARSSSSAPSVRWPRTRASSSRSSWIRHLPPAIHTDDKRLQQVLKNLLSNAFKFTERGTVVAQDRARRRAAGTRSSELLNRANAVVAFSVTDTGIGIPTEKQRIIFEAFQQATAPPAASTAAPAWACRSAARSPGCWAARSGSRARRGRAAPSRCTCRVIYPGQPVQAPTASPQDESSDAGRRGDAVKVVRRRASRVMLAPVVERAVADDRSDIEPGDRILLIVEDDPNFAQILLDLAREQGFKGLVRPARRPRAGAGAGVSARRHHARIGCPTPTAGPCSTG